MTNNDLEIRPFEHRDVEEVLDLMRSLAVFEGYIDDFRVTAADVIEHGLGTSPRFGVFVATLADKVVGIAVHYEIPWTYDLKPVVVLKELFVAAEARGLGAGKALFQRLAVYAGEIGASKIAWTVLDGNEPPCASTNIRAASPIRSGGRGLSGCHENEKAAQPEGWAAFRMKFVAQRARRRSAEGW
ncbi:GNAT superfamily N-acetyltransferase [Pararhizobium capsulatum DSM 1112]|uniref:GNAT superfamily N-acetyltransferase n=1 Tax=Pararhizobium capsulatum DSM 1112 TaxID=1121113 RepID=A0ABU0BKQ0_9HYPH|nr:GNAT family N-acetyltransferase [Pararhizobium capsulatum]MDQ0318825.1 GNAT superfamily N-acetyltransferase [Pararhizobium capsulatum DSM 1112]